MCFFEGIVGEPEVDPYVLRYGDEGMVRKAVRVAIDEAGGPGRRVF